MPRSSVAVHVTVVVPNPKEVWLGEMVTLTSTRSVAVAAVRVGVVEVPVASKDCVAGGVIEGAVVSTMTTREEDVALFVAASVAVHTTVVVPSPNEVGL